MTDIAFLSTKNVLHDESMSVPNGILKTDKNQDSNEKIIYLRKQGTKQVTQRVYFSQKYTYIYIHK